MLAPWNPPCGISKVNRLHGGLPVHSRAQCRLLCGYGMGDHLCRVPRHWGQNSVGSHCHAAIAPNDTQIVPQKAGAPHPPCRWPTLRLEPVQSRHEDAPTPGVYNHTYHRVASVPGHRPTQLPALDTSHPSTGTTWPSNVGKYPRGSPFWGLFTSPAAVDITV